MGLQENPATPPINRTPIQKGGLTENISNLIHEGFVGEVGVFDVGKLFEELSLVFGERFWGNQGRHGLFGSITAIPKRGNGDDDDDDQ